MKHKSKSARTIHRLKGEILHLNDSVSGQKAISEKFESKCREQEAMIGQLNNGVVRAQREAVLMNDIAGENERAFNAAIDLLRKAGMGDAAMLMRDGLMARVRQRKLQ